jgi:hypothetical protein
MSILQFDWKYYCAKKLKKLKYWHGNNQHLILILVPKTQKKVVLAINYAWFPSV